MPAPTIEQEAAVAAFRDGEDLTLQAGAGTGKTTTLTMLAAATPRRGLYMAFNKAIAVAAAQVFPPTVECRTTHSLAYRAVGHRYRDRMANAVRIPSWQVGAHLGIAPNLAVRIGERRITGRTASMAALQTVSRFCHSAAREITAGHVPRLRGLEADPLHAELAELVLPYARRAWADLQNPYEGAVRFDHDHYLKMWALTEPRIEADFLLLDEAQDTNPAVERLFTGQRGRAQLVMVGDSAQAIYGWRGARDVMSGFDGTRLALSRSFRFGPALAEEANRWLTLVDAPIRLSGTPDVPTELAAVERPDAILCRTNLGTMAEIMALLQTGGRVGLVGGGEGLATLTRAARDLKAGRRTWHPELALFETWGDLQDYAQFDPAGRDLRTFVDLVDEHGPEVLLDALSRLTDERDAEVVVSTAHKAKGREWTRVRIGGDFRGGEPEVSEGEDGERRQGRVDDAEARLAYVAVTRARHRLDLGGLSWIDRYAPTS
ncbi:UvrD-helicase domain-containing protein [Planomonospora parontospora]|uniref:UvrD-helicase domain-containing protein n=1 Tax=Planomonospora parontospora TaxID=58119 RepID=UPI0016712735|nr:UvrD-helicase domain-containing protein [Planomonospora parontospora]GGL08154.1 DNA helicase [Planomonospora parontospora subsp. antibiotica]GII14572.1 DNA helicase [Planomonospora parontospora subsp. antibiotica]